MNGKRHARRGTRLIGRMRADVPGRATPRGAEQGGTALGEVGGGNPAERHKGGKGGGE